MPSVATLYALYTPPCSCQLHQKNYWYKRKEDNKHVAGESPRLNAIGAFAVEPTPHFCSWLVMVAHFLSSRHTTPF